jgi:Tripartite tricarboxylate transporter TctB family
MLRVKSPQDFGAAILFLIIGICGIYFGRELAFGSTSKMGPGFFPTILSCIIALIGAVVGLRSLVIEGPPIEPVKLRPLLFILIAILAFGYLIDQIGLAITTAGLTIFAAYARQDVKLKETLILAIILAVFAVGVFAYALGQPLPIWWGS